MPSCPCLEPRCPNFATYRGRCDQHKTERDKSISRAGRHIYNTKRWKLTRKRKLFLDPLCKCGAIATEVHHVQDIAAGGAPFAMENLSSLCKPCHSKETRRGRVAA